MLARIEHMDMCQNVFIDGVWGAYRCAACCLLASLCHKNHPLNLPSLMAVWPLLGISIASLCRSVHRLRSHSALHLVWVADGEAGIAHCRSVKPELQLKAKLPTSTPYGAHMDIGQYGDLNTLQWVENELDPEPNMVHCEVIYGEQPPLIGHMQIS